MRCSRGDVLRGPCNTTAAVQISRRALPRPRAPVCSAFGPGGFAASRASLRATPPHPPPQAPQEVRPGSGISDQRSDDPPAGDPAGSPTELGEWLACRRVRNAADEPGRNPRRLGSGEGEPGTLGSNAPEGRGSSRRRADQGLAWKCIDVALEPQCLTLGRFGRLLCAYADRGAPGRRSDAVTRSSPRFGSSRPIYLALPSVVSAWTKTRISVGWSIPSSGMNAV